MLVEQLEGHVATVHLGGEADSVLEHAFVLTAHRNVVGHNGHPVRTNTHTVSKWHRNDMQRKVSYITWHPVLRTAQMVLDFYKKSWATPHLKHRLFHIYPLLLTIQLSDLELSGLLKFPKMYAKII